MVGGEILPQTSNPQKEEEQKIKNMDEEEEQKIKNMDLRCPVPYEEIHREALTTLYPDLFEGLRFDFKGINQRFSLSPAVLTEPKEGSETIICTSYYESGANFLDSRLMIAARVMADGKLNASLKCDLTKDLALKANAQFSQAQCHGMVSFDYKGEHSRTHLQLGNGALVGANYIQGIDSRIRLPSITPCLSLGSQVFWGGQHRKPATGIGARFDNDKMIVGWNTASTGMFAFSYVQKVSGKVSVAFDNMYNYKSGEETMSVGCDCVFKQCRLRGKIDSNGRVSGFLEQQLNKGLNFVFSAVVDAKRKDSRFGFGLSVGR
ncbi:hypothetical protein MKW94_023406 [Papaver nudicaule]|uniref:Uncharacterized protein n=1 Tax=Papaver nudicaule TaxID=74823 RepID=A0AA41SI51_PAPNU|nr:hypothetical protein [Papaver nudicaule]